MLVTAIVLIELAIAVEHPEHRAEHRFGILALAAFLLAFSIWIPSRTGGPWCAPDSLVQGHAVWHLLCALATWLIYQQARSEGRRAGSSPGPADSA
jgi:hypothetical protein